jgi:glycosidase
MQHQLARSRLDRARLSACATLVALSATIAAVAATPTDAGASASFRERLPQDEVIYFLLTDRFENGDPSNDRGGSSGGRLVTGFDPTDAGFYHGGDLKGLISKLDYIQSLGATAIWLAPIFKNKPVQGGPGHESAAYHGYWITDFTRPDPHFGTEAELHQFITAAHERGIKVYFDIVTNHTADVISYKECPASACPYRSRADFPYSRRGGIQGQPINEGFKGDEAPYQTASNFAKLTRPDYAYTPYVPAGEEHIKVPEWLNNPLFYHNRGNTDFKGESSTFGDFDGLDDLMTENPQVVRGFIDIYGAWIERYQVDGYRIDSAKHVNPEFWQRFVPAMLDRARAEKIPNFRIFGEASAGADPAALAVHTRVDHLPAVLDFAFAAAVRQTVAGKSGTAVLARVFEDDVLYEGGTDTALQLPTFVSNHDDGRFAYFVRKLRPGVSDEETLKRVLLAHAMLFTLRGVPVVYYGDEQGFAGIGGDKEARQDMFATQVPSYRADRLLGGNGTHGSPGEPRPSPADQRASHFDTQHPLYRAIAELAQLRHDSMALRRGRQIVRSYGQKPGVFAVSRIDPNTGAETVVAFNTSTRPITALVPIEVESLRFLSMHGRCSAAPAAPGSYPVEIPALEYVACAAVAGK